MKITGVVISAEDNEPVIGASSIILSTFKNKITRLSDSGSDQIISGSFIQKVGEPINSFYMPKAEGVDPETGLVQYYVTRTDENGVQTQELTTSYDDATANGRQICGSRIPDFTGSFSNSFRYRNFDLSVLTTFSVGGKVYDTTYASLMNARNMGYSLSKDMLNRWQKPGDVTDVPRIQAGRNAQYDDRFLLDASYFTLKNISLGYNLPKSWLKTAGIRTG